MPQQNTLFKRATILSALLLAGCTPVRRPDLLRYTCDRHCRCECNRLEARYCVVCGESLRHRVPRADCDCSGCAGHRRISSSSPQWRGCAFAIRRNCYRCDICKPPRGNAPAGPRYYTASDD